MLYPDINPEPECIPVPVTPRQTFPVPASALVPQTAFEQSFDLVLAQDYQREREKDRQEQERRLREEESREQERIRRYSILTHHGNGIGSLRFLRIISLLTTGKDLNCINLSCWIWIQVLKL
jgi:hypothetical protein